jgi:uncharacterized protein YcnI
MEFLTPEWSKAYKALWVEFPKEMKQGWNLMGIKFVEKPENYFDEFVALVAKEKRDKEARAKFNCGTQECNGAIMCDRHYRQFVGVYD